MDWKHIQTLDRVHRGRDYQMTLVGFRSSDEVEEFIKDTKRTDYAYFPSFYGKKQLEDGTWSVDHSRADSCD